MGCGMSPLIFLVCSASLLQVISSNDDWNHQNHLQTRVDQDGNSGMELHDHTSSSHIEPQLIVFFHYSDLKVGSKMPVYFPSKDPSTTPRLLSKLESDSIPFSLSQLHYILQLFSFPDGSKQAEAMTSTLLTCELPPLKDGALKFCATSLEFMLDSVHEIYGGLSSKFGVLKTKYLSESISLLQNYTIAKPPMAILTPKSVACHRLPYPYAVYYCHGQDSRHNKVYKVLLVGEDGGRVEAVAICHMDTSEWDPDHDAFRILKTVPGASPVCHFFPEDNLVWIPLIS